MRPYSLFGECAEWGLVFQQAMKVISSSIVFLIYHLICHECSKATIIMHTIRGVIVFHIVKLIIEGLQLILK